MALSFSKFGHTNRTPFFDCGGDFHTKSCEISAHWNAPFLQIFLVSTPFIALNPSQILWSAIQSYNYSSRLSWIWQDFPFACIKHSTQYDMKRDSVWESRLDHVLQRFVGNNLLSDVVSFNNQRAQRPENTWEDTSQYKECFLLFHGATEGNYSRQNAEAEVRTRAVGGWLKVQTFAVCLHQRSRDTTSAI